MAAEQTRTKRDDEQFCSECGEAVPKAAVVCVHCGVPLGSSAARTGLGGEAILAIVLTVFFPGAGQIIYGRTGLGIAFLLATFLTVGILWIFTMPISLALTINHYSQLAREGG